MGLVMIVVGAFIGNAVIREIHRAVFGEPDSTLMKWVLFVASMFAMSNDHELLAAALFGAWLGFLANGDEQVTR